MASTVQGNQDLFEKRRVTIYDAFTSNGLEQEYEKSRIAIRLANLIETNPNVTLPKLLALIPTKKFKSAFVNHYYPDDIDDLTIDMLKEDNSKDANN